MEIAKFDDILFMEEGFRKEEIEKAIEVYKLDDREKDRASAIEEERRAYMQMASMMKGASTNSQTTPTGDTGASRPTGKQMILE